MKITNKIKLAFIPTILLPMLFMTISSYIICSYQLQEVYGLDAKDTSNMKIFINPTQIMNKLTTEVFNEIKVAAIQNSEHLEDEMYLKQLNSQLLENGSYLIVRKNNDIVFRGSTENHSEIEALLPEYGTTSSSIDGGLYISDPENVLIKQQDFNYQDRSRGSIFILMELNKIIPHVKVLFLRIIIAVAGILIVTCSIISWLIHCEFIKPIKLLKDATDRIKEGDLESELAVLNHDELGELCESFNQMRVKLKASIDDRLLYEKENRELISNISHDLKTPITAIKGYVEGIMDGVADTPEKMERYIRTIYNKANDMDALINELSLYTKIDCNSIPYNFSKIQLDDYFRDCVEEIIIDLEAKNIDLAYFNYCNKDAVVVADPEQLKRVINNIITNAAKYNDKKKGHVNIRLREIEDFIQVEIEDNGKGISTGDLPYIFDRLYRADSSRNSSKGGSGLGLSIAKKIIEEHGGSIWATSKEETGTSIYFTIKKWKE